ncbi:MAG: maleylpyruvate isomerase N-terminal domain-containing protein [Chloroflexota bacterium]
MVPRVEALLNEMAEHRSHFEKFCRSLSEDELATKVPDSPWTVFDYIAHLATIEALINPWFGAMVGSPHTGEHEVPPKSPFDLDDWNELIVARRHGRTLDDIFDEALENRGRYATNLSKMTDEQLDMKVPFGGDRKVIDLPPVIVPLISILTGIALHDVAHTRDILRALPGREADVKSWLDSVDLSRMDPEMAARRV